MVSANCCKACSAKAANWISSGLDGVVDLAAGLGATGLATAGLRTGLGATGAAGLATVGLAAGLGAGFAAGLGGDFAATGLATAGFGLLAAATGGTAGFFASTTTGLAGTGFGLFTTGAFAGALSGFATTVFGADSLGVAVGTVGAAAFSATTGLAALAGALAIGAGLDFGEISGDFAMTRRLPYPEIKQHPTVFSSLHGLAGSRGCQFPGLIASGAIQPPPRTLSS